MFAFYITNKNDTMIADNNGVNNVQSGDSPIKVLILGITIIMYGVYQITLFI